MFDTLKEMLSLPLMQRALIVGLLVSFCASLLGVSLVLKRYSMLGDGLSHIGFGALSVGAAAGLTPIYIAMPTVIISAFFLLNLSENAKVKGDAAIAIISSCALSLGIIASKLSSSSVNIEQSMFGSIVTVSEKDVKLSIALSVLVILLFVLFYNKLFAVTFDEAFTRAVGAKVKIYNMIIAVFTAVTVVLGIRMMGTLLISSLIVFPAITAMQIFKSFKSVITASAIISVLSFAVGFLICSLVDLPIGATIVLVNLAIFVIFSVAAKFKT